MASPEHRPSLMHRLGNRLSAQLYSIYLYTLAQKNTPEAQNLAIARARLVLLRHSRYVLPIIYRTRVVPVLGRHAKQLTPAQINEIMNIPQYLTLFKIILNDSSRVDLEYVVFEASKFIEKSEEYWRTAMGLKRRVSMLGGFFHYRLVNGALQAYGGDPDVSGWLGIPGETEHCEYCVKHIIGHYFHKGQFLPPLPAHYGCTCGWQLVKKQP